MAVVGLALIALYFLPTIIAAANHHRKRDSIIVINLFLGWTLIGWVVSLAMSVDQSNWQKTSRLPSDSSRRHPPHHPDDPSTFWPPAPPTGLPPA